MTGVGKDPSCVFRGLVGPESITGHYAGSASYVCAIITQIDGVKGLRHPPPHDKTRPATKGGFPGVDHQGVYVLSRTRRENLHFRKR